MFNMDSIFKVIEDIFRKNTFEYVFFQSLLITIILILTGEQYFSIATKNPQIYIFTSLAFILIFHIKLKRIINDRK